MSGQPIKVLHLIPTLSSGGAERQLVNLVSGTSDKIVNHVVCVISKAEFFAPIIRQAGHKVIELKISAKHPFLRAATKFRQIIREEKPDIIHSWLYDANISARLAKLLDRKTPLITSLQLPDYEPKFARIAGWNLQKVRVLKAIDKFTALIAQPYFVPCSHFVKNSYQKNYGIDERKTEVIYNSVNSDLLSVSEDDLKKLHEEFAFPSDAFVFLNVGRLDPQKNHKVMFEAFRHVLAEIPNSFLLLAGVGTTATENDLKNLTEDLQISDKVYFLGRRNDVDALLEFADVFIFPSMFEGLGVALIEAMFKSLPCIVSRIEIFEEVITDGETGLMVEPTSPFELKDAMIKLYQDAELRRSLGEKGFQVAKAKFNVTATARQWEKFYQKVKFGL